VAGVDRDELGLRTAAEERTHALARADDLAHALEPRNVGRHPGGRRIPPGALHQVGVVDPGGADADQQLALAGHRVRPLLDLDPAVTYDRRPHLA
jgi:hypothetical protein